MFSTFKHFKILEEITLTTSSDDEDEEVQMSHEDEEDIDENAVNEVLLPSLSFLFSVFLVL